MSIAKMEDKMNFKLIAVDADGTLLGENHTISEENKMAIRQATENGVKIVLCSGRSYASLKHFAQEIGVNGEENYIISFNGCVIHDLGNGEMLRNVKLPKKTAIEILNIVNKYEVEIVIYWDVHEVFLSKFSEYTQSYVETSKVKYSLITDYEGQLKDEIYKVLLLGENETLMNVQRDLAEIKDKNYNIFLTSPYLLEFTPIPATKGKALQFLCDYLGIDIKDTIAIGDSYNDINMIESAGVGVAMQNADDAVKAYADYVTEKSNFESGVAEVINKYIKEKRNEL